MSYQAREPHTPMEWRQERVERMYASEDRRDWETRFAEIPTNESPDDESETDRPEVRR